MARASPVLIFTKQNQKSLLSVGFSVTSGETLVENHCPKYLSLVHAPSQPLLVTLGWQTIGELSREEPRRKTSFPLYVFRHSNNY